MAKIPLSRPGAPVPVEAMKPGVTPFLSALMNPLKEIQHEQPL